MKELASPHRRREVKVPTQTVVAASTIVHGDQGTGSAKGSVHWNRVKREG